MTSNLQPVSIWIYNALTYCFPLLLLLGIVQLALAISFWRAEKRKKRLTWGAILLVAASMVPVGQLILWRKIIQPSMEAAMLAEKDSKSELQAGDNSVLRVGDRVSGVDSFLANAGLSKKKPKMIVLNFFATWCGPCIAELPHLQELSDKYSNRDDILFVVVGREETQETLDAFVSKNGYRIQFIADPEKKLYSEFAKELIPRTYLIDEGRSIRFEILGFDQRKLEELDGMIEDFAK